MWKGRLPMKGAPYWYNTPIEDLDFEWSHEDKVEIERYCTKILKNIEEEGGNDAKRTMAGDHVWKGKGPNDVLVLTPPMFIVPGFWIPLQMR